MVFGVVTKFPPCSCNELVKLPGLEVGANLLIPALVLQLVKLRERFVRSFADARLDFFNFTHEAQRK